VPHISWGIIAKSVEQGDYPFALFLLSETLEQKSKTKLTNIYIISIDSYIFIFYTYFIQVFVFRGGKKCYMKRIME